MRVGSIETAIACTTLSLVYRGADQHVVDWLARLPKVLLRMAVKACTGIEQFCPRRPTGHRRGRKQRNLPFRC